MSTTGKKKKSSKHHGNSAYVIDLAHRIMRLETALKTLGIVVTYPDQHHESTPMIGHTKGNTASNRKVIKRHQRSELENVVLHLQCLLPSDHELQLQVFRRGEFKDRKRGGKPHTECVNEESESELSDDDIADLL